ncbi:VasL domain-containing protein [Xenorhabdus bovienii]|uniref:ImpA N-terminal domain-containing protein n=1 Tax=Xenorhabdus bovienii TaxID=40576 RepID=A0A0B6X1G2_XENBV|nr:VasL domain-containing protein [Xenorhabdus bovienii]CDM87567.1 protein of unknown function [Xenorhabdus bovienii]
MSEHPENLIIRAGGSPQNLPEFAVIRDEINKISHPAQPEVNWVLVESLSLTLFRRNGVDLQTAIYYTLARMQLNGLAGFTEGCELLAGVIVSEWDALWPPQPAVRTDLLEWFHTRTGSQLRQMDFGTGDLRMIYRAERALQLIIDRLQQSDLKRLPRGWSAWQGFGLGALLGVLVLVGSGLLFYQPLHQQLTAITAHPAGARLAWLYQSELAGYQRQLDRLAETPLLATWDAARTLTDTAEKQWPDSAEQRSATRQWTQAMTARIESIPLKGSWHTTRDQLQQLADKILLQERTRGSFTLSYLKTAVYDLQRSHGSEVPLEELLRQLNARVASGEAVPPVLLKGIDDRFNALLGRYDRLRQATENPAEKQTEKQTTHHESTVTPDGGHVGGIRGRQHPTSADSGDCRPDHVGRAGTG